jgi:hypothetical protein
MPVPFDPPSVRSPTPGPQGDGGVVRRASAREKDDTREQIMPQLRAVFTLAAQTYPNGCLTLFRING